MLLQTEISEAQLKGFRLSARLLNSCDQARRPETRGVGFVKGSNTCGEMDISFGAESRRDQSAHALYRGTDGVHIRSRISAIRSLAREVASG